jgi:hypothetical protein
MASASAFSETIVVTATLRDGGSLYGRFLVSNMAGAAGRAQFRMRVSAGGQDTVFETRKARGEWTATREPLGADLGAAGLRIEPGRARFWMKDDAGAEAEIVLTPLAPGLRPAGGQADFGQGKRYETAVLMPAARVEGSYRPANLDHALVLDGLAYLEQRVSTILPFRAAERWYTLRQVDPDRVIVLSAWDRPAYMGGQTHAWLMVAGPGGIEHLAESLSLEPGDPERDEPSGRSFPRTLRFSDPTSGLVGVVKADRLIERTDDLAGLSTLERLVVERLMKPVTLRFEARYAIRHLEARVEGKAIFGFQSFR